jgi:ornithine carbamoyltransferase
MQSLLLPLQGQRLESLQPEDVSVLLANARQLERAVDKMPMSGLFRGKNLGLLCQTEVADDALLFRRAAEDLGARVAHIRSSLSKLSSPRLVRDTARTLGRLYDAIECQGLASDLVRQIGDEAGVPVYDNIAGASHPTARLADLLGTGRSHATNRRLVLQAALMSTLL